MLNPSVLRIMLAKGAGDALLRKISRAIQSGLPYSLEELCEDPNQMKTLGIPEEIAQNIYTAKEDAFRLEEELQRENVGMYWIGDEEYPRGIKKLQKGTIPAILFYKGNYGLTSLKSVGFTGSRKVSDSGLQITERTAVQLSKREIVVVSGYAKGVDMTAHKTALQEGSGTIFVMAEGILKKGVKREIKELLTEENHLFLSQFMPHSIWSASNAMKRNNTIIGLSDVMVLIEAAMDGGTFDAGQQCLKNEKPLFVVEYAAEKPTSQGNTYFLKRGGVPLKGDRTGMPVLKGVYKRLEDKAEEPVYEQMRMSV